MIAENKNNLEKVQHLINYILQYCQETPTHIVADCSKLFQNLFTNISSNDNLGDVFENGEFDLFKIIVRATVKIWLSIKHKYNRTLFISHFEYSELADSFLYITAKIKSMNLPEDFKEQFNDVVVQLVKEDIRFIHHQSLLRRIIKSTETETWASVELMGLLLESGADIQSKDYFQRTPLMYALKYRPDDHIREILELFIEYKCHLDCRDNEGFSAMDLPRWASLSFVPRSSRSLWGGIIKRSLCINPSRRDSYFK